MKNSQTSQTKKQKTKESILALFHMEKEKKKKKIKLYAIEIKHYPSLLYFINEKNAALKYLKYCFHFIVERVYNYFHS